MAYSIGKISVTKNNATITGVHTQFISVAKVQTGDLVYLRLNQQNQILQVAQVISDTQLRLALLDGQRFNPQESGSELPYGLVQNFNNSTPARLAKSLTELQTKWHRREKELTGWFQSNEATFPVTNFLGEQSEIATPAEINRNAVKVAQLIEELEAMVASIAQAAQNADDAAASASAAAASKIAAKTSENNAAASKVAAKASEDAAKASQSAAAGSAISAGLSKSAAASSKAAAADSAAAALASEDAAKVSETAAASSASSAASSKTAAASSQSAAASSASSAAASKAAAKTSETNAAASKVAAKASEDAAKASQSAAAGSATSAASSKSAAKASEDKVAEHAAAALASEDAAKVSETAAASSASSAASSKTAAASSQSAAASSASSAAASKAAAKTSETNAAASKVAAKASEDAAKASQSAAAGSATSAASSKSAAKASEDKAAEHASAALASEDAAKASETAAASSASSAASSKTAAASSKSAAASSASSAAASKAAAKTSETNAAASKVAAKASEDAAKASQSAAAASATSAASSKSAAKVSEDKAAEHASAALASEDAAKVSETAAASSASSAASSKTAAASSKSAAASSASSAAASKAAAKTSETNAAASKVAAKASEDAAKASQSAAAGSAISAGLSKSAAASSKAAAAESAEAALGSEEAAKASETAAANSASSAASSKTAAASSQSAAASSASAAATSKAAAKTSETNAASSATAAAASKAAAKTSESNAAQSAATAQASQVAAKASEDSAANSVVEAQSIRNEVAEIAGGTAPDSQRLGGKTKEEVVSEARAGLQAADSKLQRLVDSEFDFTHGNDFRLRGGRALVAHTPEMLYVNYNGDFSNVSAKGAWAFSDSVKVSGVTLETTTGEYGDKAFKVSNGRGYLKLGAQNDNFCHYETDRPNHWFNKELKVKGDIYAGEGYNQRVYHEGNKPLASDVKALPSISGRTPLVTKSEFKTIAKVTGAELASMIRLNLKGTTDSTVVAFSAEIIVNHHSDFTIKSLSGPYSQVTLRLLSNTNEHFLIQAKVDTPSAIAMNITVQSYGQEVIEIGDFNTEGYPQEFIHEGTKSGIALSSADNREATITVQGNQVYHEGHKPTPSEIGAVAKGESIDLTNQALRWVENSDGAAIGFQNTSDQDTNSYLYFETSDNLNEYFRWQHRSGSSITEWMSLKDWGLKVKGYVTASGLAINGNATFDNGDNTTVNIRANDSGAAVLNVCAEVDAQTTGIVYVGQSPNHGGGIEYNGDNSPVTSGSGADYFTLFRRSSGQTHWTARNLHLSNDWEFRGKVKAAALQEGDKLLSNKYHGKSDKLARFESSHVDTNSGQDLKIRDKRALVGATDQLYINYGSDWSKVAANGEWAFTGDVKVSGDLKMSGTDSYIWSPNTANGYTGIYDSHTNKVAMKYTNSQAFDFGADINISKNNPWLTLDSSSSGSNTNEQAAGISIGESGRDNSASLHLSYIGDGYSYIGMGNLGSDNIADNWAMQMNYQSRWVKFRSDIQLQDSNTKLAKGVSNTVRAITNNGYVDIGPQNSNWCHFDTDREKFYFGRPTYVKGDIYAGPNYNQKVIHQGNFNQQLQASANQVTSGDSQKFAGKTEQEWQDYIQDPVRAAVAATNPIAAAFI
ncbi:hypothetical protein HG263_02995 [Pseudoalteromonas sp. JBTF-M23]|uniref:Methyl-accepting transducer domain-containing protein n=1 Tax=Pseudoalteromonas caenipelagi TaxID=2726988 RepID=A0A849V9D3_9GAMM|nr:hypothetical protein [Pseudoalteromonas caenipelagi]NOU49515.1 hypothetical protein [Pseudoalteromonas caenipelagi]